MKPRRNLKKIFLLAAKIGLGSSLAILAAYSLHLDNTISAGTIALLTLMTTRWESVRLSLYRLITFMISVVIAWFIVLYVDNVMVAYGLYVFFTVLIAEYLGWRATISVNAVAGAHLFISNDFSGASIINEFALVLIGIILALFINLFHDNRSHRVLMVADMRKTEENLQEILNLMAAYLLEPGHHSDVWPMITDLEERLRRYMDDAREYQDNTFLPHSVYYTDYFEMRYDQCQVLYSLHFSMRKIRSIPEQAKIVAGYMKYLSKYVIEKNDPKEQEIMLQALLDHLKDEKMPESRDEFESRALLYHILMDLESFLTYKRNFVEKLDEKQLQRYWYSHNLTD
ncbi:MAG: hypothetical protein IJH71_07280 [Eubacterium sp.]|nr:hypothetical protein [Eubacterium sp.]